MKTKQYSRLPFFLIFLCLFLFLENVTLFGSEDNLHYSLRKEVITVRSMEEGYTASVYCRGKFTSLPGRETAIVYSELEALGGIRARYQNSRGKYKDLPDEYIHNSAVIGGSFYAGLNQYVLSWPSKGEEELRFLYTYRINCKELMTLSALPINDIDKTDTFEYDIRVPKGLGFSYHFPQGLSNLYSDIVQTDSGTIYRFRVCPPEKINLLRNLQTYEYNAYAVRFFQLEFVPPAYEGKGWTWLNDWYNKVISGKIGLNTESNKIFDRVIGTATDPDSIAAHVFNFVKTRITYLDVENGLGAFCPREGNEVLANRQGDCKDMASLICEVLQKHGIEAYRAISSTISHDVDFDFPSLSSGNHMICVARIRDQWVFLDGTDAVCPYGLPSMQIQGRKLFVLNSKGGERLTVPFVDASRNKMLCEMKLNQQGDQLTGAFNYSYLGLSRHDEHETRFAVSASEYNNISMLALENNSHHTSFADFSRAETDSVLSLTGNMQVNQIFSSFNNKNSLILNFLPFPHKYPRIENKGTKIITYQALDNRFVCKVELQKSMRLQPFESVEFNRDGFRFSFKVDQTGPHTLNIYYSYFYNDVIIPETKMKTYYELNTLIEQTLRKTLVYE
jgi:hypothetical protein